MKFDIFEAIDMLNIRFGRDSELLIRSNENFVFISFLTNLFLNYNDIKKYHCYLNTS